VGHDLRGRDRRGRDPDRLLHHQATVLQIDGDSDCVRGHRARLQ
jgi:hypothetical protein